MALLIPAIALLILGAAVGRAWVLAVPVIAWPGFVLGVRAGLWGNGVGDGWVWGLVLGTAAGVLLAAVGLVIHVAYRRIHRSPRATS